MSRESTGDLCKYTLFNIQLYCLECGAELLECATYL